MGERPIVHEVYPFVYTLILRSGKGLLSEQSRIHDDGGEYFDLRIKQRTVLGDVQWVWLNHWLILSKEVSGMKFL